MKCVLVLAEHIPSRINEDGNGAHDTILGTETEEIQYSTQNQKQWQSLHINSLISISI